VIEEALTRFPGVYRRNDSATYQFGLRVPKDLAEHYEGDWAVRCSLKTADLRKANEKARELQAQWARTFEQQRGGTLAQAPQTIQTAPDLGKLRAAILARLEAFVDALDARVASHSAQDREEKASSIRWQREETLNGIQGGYVPDWQADWVDRSSASLGVPRSPVVDMELLKWYVSIMDFQLEALTDPAGNYPVRIGILAARRSGLPSAQGAAAPVIPKEPLKDEASHYIADALDLWKKGRPRSRRRSRLSLGMRPCSPT
jgi:hypothetical protein